MSCKRIFVPSRDTFYILILSSCKIPVAISLQLAIIPPGTSRNEGATEMSFSVKLVGKFSNPVNFLASVNNSLVKL